MVQSVATGGGAKDGVSLAAEGGGYHAGKGRGVLGFIIKLLIGIGAIIVLVEFGFVDFGALAAASDRPGPLFGAFLLLLATVPLAAARWWMLLQGLELRLGLLWSLKATFVSLFCHTFLPGAYGGDVVRLAMAYRVTRGRINRLTFSVITDRLTGLIALIFLALITSLPGSYASEIRWISSLAVGAALAGLTVALFWGDRLASLAQRLPAPVGSAAAHILRELFAALRLYLAKPLLLAGAVTISLIQYTLVLGALVVIGEALGLRGLSVPGYVVAGVWSLVANAIPITPGGLGVGEAAFGQVAQTLAEPSASGEGFATVFLVMRILSIGVGMLGVIPLVMGNVKVSTGLASLRAAEGSDGVPARVE